MNDEITQAGPVAPTAAPTGPGAPAVAAVRDFTVQLSSTRRGARLARLLATERLRAWGLSWETAVQVISELTANAALHGRVRGRDFRLALSVTGADGGHLTLRIEVTDTRGDRLPVQPGTTTETTEGTDPRASGHGLVIVEALADRWGVSVGPVPRKTVWAEITFGG